MWGKRYDPNRPKVEPAAPRSKTVVEATQKTVTVPPQKRSVNMARKPSKTPLKSRQPAVDLRQSPRFQGEIIHYLPERAFGFLTLEEGGPEIFFHKKSVISAGEATPTFLPGARVSFQAKPGRGGRGSLEAINIQLEEDETIAANTNRKTR